jgi:hypothetical protein
MRSIVLAVTAAVVLAVSEASATVQIATYTYGFTPSTATSTEYVYANPNGACTTVSASVSAKFTPPSSLVYYNAACTTLSKNLTLPQTAKLVSVQSALGASAISAYQAGKVSSLTGSSLFVGKLYTADKTCSAANLAATIIGTTTAGTCLFADLSIPSSPAGVFLSFTAVSGGSTNVTVFGDPACTTPALLPIVASTSAGSCTSVAAGAYYLSITLGNPFSSPATTVFVSWVVAAFAVVLALITAM